MVAGNSIIHLISHVPLRGAMLKNGDAIQRQQLHVTWREQRKVSRVGVFVYGNLIQQLVILPHHTVVIVETLDQVQHVIIVI